MYAPVGKVVTEETFFQVINDPELISNSKRARELYGYYLSAPPDDKEEKKKRKAAYDAVKHKLPQWLPYEAPEGAAKTKENAKRISVGFFDSDHFDREKWIEEFCKKYSDASLTDPKERIASACNKTHIWGLADSSGDGEHIYAELNPEMTFDENFEYYEGVTGLKFDKDCKNTDRGAYVEDINRWRYYNLEKLLEHKVIELKEPIVVKEIVNSQPSTSSDQEQKPAEPQSFMGITMKDIVEKWWEQRGGDLKDGERHQYFPKFAQEFRFICHNNPKEVLNAAKSYSLFGMDEREVAEMCLWACNTPEHKEMSPKLRMAIDSLLPKDEVDEQPSVKGMYNSPVPPAMPKLPPLIEALTSPLPKPYKAAAAQNCFPALGVLPQQEIEFEYADHSKSETALMGITIGQTSGGKSSLNMVIDRILQPINAHDQVARQNIEAWKEQWRMAGNSKNKPQKPQGLYIQVVNMASTKAALVDNLKSACGRYLYTMMDEPESLQSINTATSRNEDKLVIKLAFHNQLYGQERYGTDSISALLPMRWNWNMSTTIQKIQKYFRGGIADGPLNRISFGFIEQEKFADLPIFSTYKKRANDIIDTQIANLMNASGKIVSRDVNRLTLELIHECKQTAEQCDDDTLFMFSKRACVIAFRKAMILYIANGCKWHKTFDEFIRWTLHYDLWVKMRFFGSLAKKEMEGETIINNRGPQNLLQLLPEKFTREQLVQLRLQLGMNPNPNQILKVWTHRHYIELQEDGSYLNKKRK